MSEPDGSPVTPAPIHPTGDDRVFLKVTPDPIERVAIDIRGILKSSGGRGEPDPAIVDRLLTHYLVGQATALRKGARLVGGLDAREKLRDLADDLDPTL
jgi:hypothetical protein